MKIWIVWLPNVGKSTLFNALTRSYSADAANFPFCTIEPNVGIVNVVDSRVDTLAEISHSKNSIYATTKFVDIAGLVKGASKGEWLGNKFLSHIREVDAIVQVVRHFSDDDVAHVEWSVDPLRDIEIINTELIMSDIEQIEPKLPQLEKQSKIKWTEATKLYPILKKIYDHLMLWKLAIDLEDWLSTEEKELVWRYNFLTYKPFIYTINIDQQDLIRADEIKTYYFDILKKPVSIVSAKLESEMIDFSFAEKSEYIASLWDVPVSNIPTLDDTIKLSFDTLGLMYYFTTWDKETRARTIHQWSTAPIAAGAIHTDFTKWFIKAEIVNYEKFVQAGSRSKAKESWFVKLEGKDYIVKDGDIIIFRFNVS
jgi:GTP-binding protein YchF